MRIQPHSLCCGEFLCDWAVLRIIGAGDNVAVLLCGILIYLDGRFSSRKWVESIDDWPQAVWGIMGGQIDGVALSRIVVADNMGDVAVRSLRIKIVGGRLILLSRSGYGAG